MLTIGISFMIPALWPIGGEDPIGPAPTALKDFAIRVASGFCDLENVA
jgi:hypothetical protein